MLIIDGSQGEGGGQILRTSLALALVTGKAFRIERIRAGRKTPGLLRQHLTALNAAVELGRAEVTGAALGAREFTFTPHGIFAGDYAFAVGTAGSTSLVFQTILPALMLASAASTLSLEGGTHNPFAPPFDFLAKAFLPLVNRMGPKVIAKLERPGFHPAGGGKFSISIEPASALTRLDILERGEIRARQAKAIIANLPQTIAERELAVIKRKMAWSDDLLCVEQANNARGQGNAVLIEIESKHVTEVFTAFGERGVSAERVADKVVKKAQQYLNAEVAVGEHLADQLLLPLALAGGGSFTTHVLSQHTTTNTEVIKKFLDVEIVATPLSKRTWNVEISS